MVAIGEIVVHFIVEVLAYAVGRIIAVVFLPHLKIESLGMQKTMPAWRWRSFTYKRGSDRFLYTESIQILGITAIFAFGIAAFVIARYAN